MMTRTTTRTIVALVTAFCVTMMFTGSAAAVPIGDDVGVGDDLDVLDGLTGADDDRDGANTVHADVSVDDEGVAVFIAGEGEIEGSLDCELAPEPPENPEDVCEYELPGDDDELELPILDDLAP